MRSPGRPKQITAQTLAVAGADIGLRDLSIRSLAARLGVSEMSVYRQVGNLHNLRDLVAGEVLKKLDPPQWSGSDPEQALLDFALYLRGFVVDNPGIGEYLTGVTASGVGALRVLEASQAGFARHFGFEPGRASAVLAVLAHQTIAVTHLDRASALNREDAPLELNPVEFPTIAAGAVYVSEFCEGPDAGFVWTIRATIRGLLELTERNAEQ